MTVCEPSFGRKSPGPRLARDQFGLVGAVDRLLHALQELLHAIDLVPHVTRGETVVGDLDDVPAEELHLLDLQALVAERLLLTLRLRDGTVLDEVVTLIEDVDVRVGTRSAPD